MTREEELKQQQLANARIRLAVENNIHNVMSQMEPRRKKRSYSGYIIVAIVGTAYALSQGWI